MDLKDIIKRTRHAALHYGYKNQRLKCIEELGEFMVELSKFDPVGAKAVDVFKFQDEVADCLIVLMQMAHFSDSEIVDDGFIGVRSRVEEKLYRLEERIINNRPDDHIWIEDVGEDNVGMGE